MDVQCVLFLVCLYICVCECLLQNNIAGVPSSRATSGFPQYCASTCVRFGCTRHARCVDSKPPQKKKGKTKNQIPGDVSARAETDFNFQGMHMGRGERRRVETEILISLYIM